MRILLLGYGIEGKSAENYIKNHFKDAAVDILENFTPTEIKQRDYSSYDIIFRSPSVPPLHLKNESSITKYFFDHCPCPIIGVTATKGKGTVCSLIAQILETLGEDVKLVGNIGVPAVNVLDQLSTNSIVVYEMSSFQLWDLDKSPHIAVVLRIEADHLNVHYDFNDYVTAKSHIAKYQSPNDHLVYFKNNQNSVYIADQSPAIKHPYPNDHKSPQLVELLSALTIPGDHNKENAEAAILAVAAYYNQPVDNFISEHYDKIKTALAEFKGLPHHIEFVRSVNGVEYYDDSFSASYPSLDVALKAFPGRKVFLIAGGKDRGLDLDPMKRAIFDAPNLSKAFFIGETKFKLTNGETPDKFAICDTLEEAISAAKTAAEQSHSPNAIVLLSPGSPSFDMFKNFYERGDKFKEIVKGL